MFRLRKTKVLPQQVSDFGAFLFVVSMIPLTYVWEVAAVSKSVFSPEGYVWYIHMLFGVVRISLRPVFLTLTLLHVRFWLLTSLGISWDYGNIF